MSSNNSSRGGLGLTTVVTIVFVVLKLTHAINWSWVWVLSPIWISFLLGVVIFLIALAVGSAAKASQRASYRSSGPVRGARNEREMYARIAERAQNDRFSKPSLSYFDQRNGVR